MRKSRRGTVLAVLVAALLFGLAGLGVAGCGGDTEGTAATTAAGAESTTAAAGASGAIAVSGLVDNPMTLTVAELEKLGTVIAKVQHPKKGEVEYTGVPFATVLAALKVQPAAKSMLLVATDGYTVEVALGDVGADSMLAIEDGMISAVFPTLDGKSWAKDIATMKVQ